MNKIPAHRIGAKERSGDTIVIGKDGKDTNVDADRREKAAKEAAAEQSKSKATAPKKPKG